MANRWFTQFLGTLEKKPVLLSCNFIVDSTNGNGLGIRSLKGPGIDAVYMHTSATPDADNPNPSAGYAIVKLQDNYSRYLGGFSGFVSPASGTPISISTGSSLTVGDVYIITSLGTTTTAQWQAVGLPVGIAPAVGVAFVATATSGSGTGQVQAPAAAGSGISVIDVIGDSNLTIKSTANMVLGQGSGAYIIVRFLAATDADTTTLVATAPADGSVVGLSFYMSNSFVKVQGE